MDKIKTHYEDLEVAESASPEIIRGAYRYLSQKWLPEKNPERRDEAERIARALDEAYAVLSDPELRQEYDAWVATQRKTKVDLPASSEPQPKSSDSSGHGRDFIAPAVLPQHRPSESVAPSVPQIAEPVGNPQATLIAERSWGRRLLQAAGIAVLAKLFGLWSIVMCGVSYACFIATKGRSKATRYAAAAGGFFLAMLAGFQFFGVVGPLVLPVNQSQLSSVQSPTQYSPEAAQQAASAAADAAAAAQQAADAVSAATAAANATAQVQSDAAPQATTTTGDWNAATNTWAAAHPEVLQNPKLHDAMQAMINTILTENRGPMDSTALLDLAAARSGVLIPTTATPPPIASETIVNGLAIDTSGATSRRRSVGNSRVANVQREQAQALTCPSGTTLDGGECCTQPQNIEHSDHSVTIAQAKCFPVSQ